MKYISQPLTPEQDGRRRILPCLYPEVIKQYNDLKSFRAVSRLFNVNKGTIKAIIDPQWYEAKKRKRYEKKAWLVYHNTTKRRICQAKHRAKRRSLGLRAN